MKRLIGFSVLLIFVAAGAVLGRVVWVWLHPEEISLDLSPISIRVAREVYPYSVVPGGVYDSRDLRQSIEKDSVARKHYEGIDPDRMWNSRLRAPMVARVSFRKGNTIYWTKNPIVIPKGELVLTDGSNLVRARCGNRIVKTPPEPLAEAAVEAPPEFVFTTAIPSLLPPTIMPPPPVQVAVNARIPEPRAWATPLWCCAEVQSGGGSSPEPGTIVLVSSGAATIIAAYRRRKRS
jgi:hypothetical protein